MYMYCTRFQDDGVAREAPVSGTPGQGQLLDSDKTGLVERIHLFPHEARGVEARVHSVLRQRVGPGGAVELNDRVEAVADIVVVVGLQFLQVARQLRAYGLLLLATRQGSVVRVVVLARFGRLDVLGNRYVGGVRGDGPFIRSFRVRRAHHPHTFALVEPCSCALVHALLRVLVRHQAAGRGHTAHRDELAVFQLLVPVRDPIAAPVPQTP